MLVGSDIEVPSGAQMIDGTGKFLMPGLAEMHGHIPRPDQPEQYTEDVLFLYVANGITTVRGMLGAPGQLGLKQRTNDSELIAPTLYLAGPSFNGNTVNSPSIPRTVVIPLATYRKSTSSVYCSGSVSYTHLTLPTTPYV